MTTRSIPNLSGGREPANAVVLLNPATGQPFTSLPVTLSGESLTVSVPASVEISNDTGNPIPVSGPVTNTELRATPVPVTMASTPGITNTELRASPVGVLAQTRTCLGVAQIVGLSTTVAASLPSIPANALTAEIQADGGSIRVRRDGTAPTATLGWRIDDGVDKTVDSALGSVRLLAVGSGTNVQIAYFDRV